MARTKVVAFWLLAFGLVLVLKLALVLNLVPEIRMMYSPCDPRMKLCVDSGLTPRQWPMLPFVQDETVVDYRQGHRAGRDVYNSADNHSQAMTAVFQHASGALLWVGSRLAAFDWGFLQANNISSRLCSANSWAPRPSRHFVDLQTTDMNDVNEGNISMEDFAEHLFLLDDTLAAGSDVLVYCRNGANRSPLHVAAYIVMKTLVGFQEVHSYLIALRRIVDLSSCERHNRVLPETFLLGLKDYFNDIFVGQRAGCPPIYMYTYIYIYTYI
jgi:hypothetical protein